MQNYCMVYPAALEGCHEETPLCRRPGPGGEWQTGATGDTG